ncbi:MAG: hypothetical protein QXI58_03800, partial [Candidatus Micrarchaeia archaeon]
MNYEEISVFEDEKVVNRIKINERFIGKIIIGIDNFTNLIIGLSKKFFKKQQRNCFIAIDGYHGVDFSTIKSKLEEGLKKENIVYEIIEFSAYFKNPKEIEELINPYITFDDHFVKLWVEGSLDMLFDADKIQELRKRLKNERNQKSKLIIGTDCGSAFHKLIDLYDYIFYLDITRQEQRRRFEKGKVKNLGAGIIEYDRGYSYRRLIAVDHPVIDRHKKFVLSRINYYVDANNGENLKVIPKSVYNKIISTLVRYPIRLKPVYIPGVWGGQFLKKVRGLPQYKKNVAWSLECCPDVQSIPILLNNKIIIDLPFLNLLWQEKLKLMGRYCVEMFDFDPYFDIYGWPISFNYDDTMDG